MDYQDRAVEIDNAAYAEYVRKRRDERIGALGMLVVYAVCQLLIIAQW